MNDKQKLLQYLESNHLMSLATLGTRLSTCTVYYAVDDNLNFYFISEPESEHCRNIEMNKTVAFSISDTGQKVTDKKVGIQGTGTAEEIRNVEKIKAMLSLWNATNSGFESVINFENIKNKVIKSKTYRITPTELKFFNEELYGPEGIEVFKL